MHHLLLILVINIAKLIKLHLVIFYSAGFSIGQGQGKYCGKCYHLAESINCTTQKPFKCFEICFVSNYFCCCCCCFFVCRQSNLQEIQHLKQYFQQDQLEMQRIHYLFTPPKEFIPIRYSGAFYIYLHLKSFMYCNDQQK